MSSINHQNNSLETKSNLYIGYIYSDEICKICQSQITGSQVTFGILISGHYHWHHLYCFPFHKKGIDVTKIDKFEELFQQIHQLNIPIAEESLKLNTLKKPNCSEQIHQLNLDENKTQVQSPVSIINPRAAIAEQEMMNIEESTNKHHRVGEAVFRMSCSGCPETIALNNFSLYNLSRNLYRTKWFDCNYCGCLCCPKCYNTIYGKHYCKLCIKPFYRQSVIENIKTLFLTYEYVQLSFNNFNIKIIRVQNKQTNESAYFVNAVDLFKCIPGTLHSEHLLQMFFQPKEIANIRDVDITSPYFTYNGIIRFLNALHDRRFFPSHIDSALLAQFIWKNLMPLFEI